MKLLKYSGSPAKSKSISHEIQRIVKGISHFLSENIINEIFPKIVSLVYEKNKKNGSGLAKKPNTNIKLKNK